MKFGARRSAKRVVAGRHPSIPGQVNFVADDAEGSGRILNISAAGAAIEGATRQLVAGSKAELFFLQPGTGRKLRAVAEVVRTTSEDGFAVRFLRLERELERLVLQAANSEKDPKGKK
jgi:c-di-GMP-binding flagellar brake protein YcgR